MEKNPDVFEVVLVTSFKAVSNCKSTESLVFTSLGSKIGLKRGAPRGGGETDI